MKILGIESSGLTASAAIVEDGILKCEFTVNNKLTHSETLLPMIREMCRISGMDAADCDAVAVSCGPGSFTGLRIGVATAKGLALAYNIPAIRVSTLDAMGVPLSRIIHSIVCPIMDARRGQTYAAAYLDGGSVVKRGAYDIYDYIGILNGLMEDGTKEFIFVGDGVPVFSGVIHEKLEGKICFAGPEYNRQRAAQVAELGASMFKDWLLANELTTDSLRALGADGIKCYGGGVMNSDELVPEYMRKSQAERENEMGLLEDAGEHSLKKLRAH